MSDRKNPTDVSLQESVLGELRWDSRVNATDVGVTVRQGVVTLAGVVETLGERIAAQDAAHRVAGVLDVANDIEVRPAGIHKLGDGDIGASIRRALELHARLPASKITSNVSGGVVTLEGEVNFLSYRDDAEAAVRHIAGVRSVINRIKVASTMTPSDIRHAISDALARQALHELKHIQIGVDAGVVTLSGTVRSWAERRAIIGTVSAMRGVVGVQDRLTIDRTM